MPDPKARWRSGNPKACPYHTRATDLFHTSSPTDAGPSGRGATPGANRALNLRRKEVIQPHLPIRLPCYDFTLIINPTFDCVPLAVRLQASGVIDSHGVTGGVYKARERIHRDILIRDY